MSLKWIAERIMWITCVSLAITVDDLRRVATCRGGVTMSQLSREGDDTDSDMMASGLR